MNRHLIGIIFFTLLLWTGTSKAQAPRLAVSPNIGVTTPILGNGIGFHLGVNPAFRLAPIFALEGQLSYVYTSIISSFISGESGSSQATNVLLGGRLYLLPESKVVRPYINLMLGRNFSTESLEGQEDVSESGLGYSAGVYLELSRLNLGLSVESPGNFLLKIGYALGRKKDTD